MKIIISPAKKMREDTDWLLGTGLPVFLEKTLRLQKILKGKTGEELKALWACNDQIAARNVERLHTVRPEQAKTPALLAYDGIQYQYMAPEIFQESQWSYVQEHLRILSGFYGILKPLDGVVPYRLEMQARLSVQDGAETDFRDLYDFWGDAPYRELTGGDSVILNLASKEYSKLIEKYQTPDVRIITCVFGERMDGKVRTKGTLAKMARGEMVRWLSMNQVNQPEEVLEFQELGYVYAPEYSKKDQPVFLK
ncbi:MAG: peroxide stress protein YaaA [Candidatus Limivivens sp.]|nr:peroxide stress protein YaaA [Candidatus Limivivens sp.]